MNKTNIHKKLKKKIESIDNIIILYELDDYIDFLSHKYSDKDELFTDEDKKDLIIAMEEYQKGEYRELK